MRNEDKFEDIVRKDLDVRASDGTYDRMRDIVLSAHGPARTTESAAILILKRRTAMKSSIVKLGVAAAIIAVMGLGIVEFIGPGSKSGLVWAEVAQRVEASQGVIYRTRDTGMGDPNSSWPEGHMMHYKSPAHARTDWYRGEQIRRTVNFDLSTKTMVWLAYDAKVYAREPMKEETVQSQQSQWMRPEDIVGRFVSCTHKKLGTKTIEGVLCEGIETTDPAAFGANYPVKTVVGRLWVAVATGYPVLIEFEVAAGAEGNIHQTVFADQFQWDVPFGPSDREISIPLGFRPLD